ncbi:hypothetical protein QFZ49_002519 [Streptomyces turgidiscabies]|uniref:Secreted protein n=1 Tax=Streptomyces turgidiscabies TaxID=85558 RepID=A0ABU0RKR5_9ACTN|nr:hypothetical protein [Streptomyces turgidiscabies]
MKRRYSVLVGVASVLAFGGLPVFVEGAQADPSCVVSVASSTSGKSLTVKVTSNPCGRKVRAYLGCINPDTFYRENKYGATISGIGSSKATCHPDDVIEKRGHQVNVPDQGWTTYIH